MKHIAARFHITAVIVGSIDIFKNQLHSQQCILTCTVSGRIPYVSLYRMGQSIHTCSRCDKRRQAQSDFGIKNRISRDQRKIIDGIFIAGLRIRDDSCQRRLTSGTCGSGNRHQKRQFFMYF